MSSSTSSSRKIYLKIVLALGGAMLAALVLLNIVYAAMGASAEGIIGRVVDARQALPQIVKEEEDLMIFFGSSMVDAGFSPRLFDRLVKEKGGSVKSFNFGFGGLNPYFQDYFSRRVKEEFESGDKRIHLTLIEFNPFQATKTRWNRAEFIVDSYMTMLASNEELLDIALDDPERGALLFNIKFLRGDISAEMFTSYFGQLIFPSSRPPRLEEPKELVQQRQELGKQLTKKFEEEYPDYDGSDWYYPWQGGGTIPEERSEDTLVLFERYYDTFQNAAHKENARQRRIATADIEGLNFEPLMIESFIRVVQNFQAISDEVKVVILPRQTEIIHYSTDAKARLAKAIAEIEAGTGVAVINQQELPQFTSDMYSDATHFARYRGDVAYTRYLAEIFGHHFY